MNAERIRRLAYRHAIAEGVHDSPQFGVGNFGSRPEGGAIALFVAGLERARVIAEEPPRFFKMQLEPRALFRLIVLRPAKRNNAVEHVLAARCAAL